jgi:hypothetical protein
VGGDNLWPSTIVQLWLVVVVLEQPSSPVLEDDEVQDEEEELKNMFFRILHRHWVNLRNRRLESLSLVKIQNLPVSRTRGFNQAGGVLCGCFAVLLLGWWSRGEDMAAAIAAAARKRAEKLGVQNEEVDESNVGKTKDTDLRNPYLSKVKMANMIIHNPL